MYVYTMQRTQIYLTVNETEVLDRISRQTGLTRSQLIRSAIGGAYIQQAPRESVERALLATAGAWKRGRHADGAAWVERRRSGRLAGLHRVK